MKPTADHQGLKSPGMPRLTQVGSDLLVKGHFVPQGLPKEPPGAPTHSA